MRVAVVLAAAVVAEVAGVGASAARDVVPGGLPARRRELVEPLERVLEEPGSSSLTQTPAVMCMALTSTMPSRMPDSRDGLGDVVGDAHPLAALARVEGAVDGVRGHRLRHDAGMDLNMTGRTAVVTGGSRGIGAAIVARCSRRRARASSPSRAQRHRHHRARRAAERSPSASAAPRRHPRQQRRHERATARSTSSPTRSGRQQWELHVMAPMRLMRHFAPRMAERGWGRIVNVALVVGQAAVADQRRLRGDEGGRAGALARVRRLLRRRAACWSTRSRPGRRPASCGWARAACRPDGAARWASSREEALEAQRAKVPLGRLGEEDEIAAVVAFLCSERASYVTGAAWSVDGGIVPTFM